MAFPDPMSSPATSEIAASPLTPCHKYIPKCTALLLVPTLSPSASSSEVQTWRMKRSMEGRRVDVMVPRQVDRSPLPATGLKI